MNDQELLEIVKKNRRKRQVKSIILNLFLVLLVLLGMGLGISKYYNLGPFEEGKVPGLPNNQISYNQTKSGDIASLAYFMSESVAFNFTGKNVTLTAASYSYGKVINEEILSPQFKEGEVEDFSGYLTIGVREEEEQTQWVDFSMNINGAGTRKSLNLKDYGLSEDNPISAYSFGDASERSRISKNKQKIDILTLSAEGAVYGDTSNLEESYKDNPWVLVLLLEFEN